MRVSLDWVLHLGKHQKALEKSAKIITITIYASFELKTQKSTISRKRKLWWNEECFVPLQKMRQTQKYQALDIAAGIENLNIAAILKKTKSKLRKMIKNAKQKHYQKVIDGLDH